MAYGVVGRLRIMDTIDLGIIWSAQTQIRDKVQGETDRTGSDEGVK